VTICFTKSYGVCLTVVMYFLKGVTCLWRNHERFAFDIHRSLQTSGSQMTRTGQKISCI